MSGGRHSNRRSARSGSRSRCRSRRLALESLESRQLLSTVQGESETARTGSAAVGGTELSAVTAARSHLHGAIEPVFLPPQYRLSSPGEYLSPPSSDDALDIAVRFLREHAADIGLAREDLNEFSVTDRYTSGHNGVTHIYLRQTHDGLEIDGADINVNVTSSGEVVSVGSSFVSGIGDDGASIDRSVRIDAADALVALAEHMGWERSAPPPIATLDSDGSTIRLTDDGAYSKDGVTARPRYVPVSDGGIELAWGLYVETPDDRHWYDAGVSAATGELLSLVDWSSHASYRVYAAPKMSPVSGPRTLESDPHLVAPDASPFGWHDTDGVAGDDHSTTRGNNVFAYADKDNNNQPDPGSVPDAGATMTFDYPINLGEQPAAYQLAAVTNLFYWVNLLHDIHYQYGFDEPAGNFQYNNYGRGGIGGDHVIAEAQDSQEWNNANFFTPPEGQSGRMQVYLWNTANPRIDGDLDSGVIIHEYGHGVSTRLTGGPGNASSLRTAQSNGLGEGWSDWYALMLTQRPSDSATAARGIGTYLVGQGPTGAGIRLLPYSYDMSVNSHTFGDIADFDDPHDIGEVWASALWDLTWLLIDGEQLDPLVGPGRGFDPDFHHGTGGNNLALQLVMDAMKLQPANPTFLDARDAILAADRINNAGANQMAIWRAFARRGMGYSADDGGSSTTLDVVEAFDLPAASAATVEFSQAAYEVGDVVEIVVRDLDPEQESLAVAVESTGGDTETVDLTRIGLGTFRGTIATESSTATVDNGVLEVTAGESVTVTYQDEDDGSGHPAVARDTAEFFVIDIPEGDLFYFDLRAGDDVTLFTETGQGDDLDVMITVYSPTGTAIHSDDNSAPDGRNAFLNFSVSQPGRYIVQVLELSGQGEYELRSEVVPAGAVLQFTSSTGSFELTPRQRVSVTVDVVGSPTTLTGFQLNFTSSNVSAGQLTLENWVTEPGWNPLNATLTTPIDTLVSGLQFGGRSAPVRIGTFDLIAPSVTGEYRLSVDYEAGTPDDTGILTISGNLEVIDFGDVVVVVAGAAATNPRVMDVRINDLMTDPADLPTGKQPTAWRAQRSDLRDVTIEFSEPITATAADVVLTNLGVDAPLEPDRQVPIGAHQIEVNDNVLRILFEHDQLDDGVYQLDLLPTITGSTGMPLDGNGDGIGGDAFRVSGDADNRFYKLTSDFNGDLGTSVFDFTTFSYWFGRPLPVAPQYVDLDDDGGVGILDFSIFATRFGRGITLPSVPAAAAGGAAIEDAPNIGFVDQWDAGAGDDDFDPASADHPLFVRHVPPAGPPDPLAGRRWSDPPRLERDPAGAEPADPDSDDDGLADLLLPLAARFTRLCQKTRIPSP